ncbi:MAG: zinc ribbon domain-containing protein [Planctomycetota bacterium]
MPLYEYRCDDCQALTEALHRMADADAQTACQACGSTQTRRVNSVFMAKADAPRPQAIPASCGPGGCPCAAAGMNGGACGMG